MPKSSLKLEVVGADTGSKSWAQQELSRLETLGWFGQGNDFNTFPNADAKDIEPKDEDFIKVPFRLLSATTVAAGSFRAASFSASVLRAATNKFLNVPVFPNHDQEVGNELGIVESVKFVNAKTTKEDLSKKRPGGLKIPAGVEGVLKIDAKSNPSVARSVLSGAITSLSVTVDFEWEPSHKLVEGQTLREWEWTIGGTAADGKMITRKVTKIRDIYEASLVWLGADPFAKAVDETGELVNIDISHATEFDSLSFLANDESSYNKVADEEKSNYFSSDKRELSATYSFRRETGTGLRGLDYNDDNQKLKSKAMKKEVLALLMGLCNVQDAESLTVEMLDGFQLIKGDKLVELEGFEAELVKVKSDLATEKSSLSKKVEELNTANNKIADLEKAGGGDTVLKEIKETLSKILPEEKDGEKVVELTAAKVGDTVREYKKGSESYAAHVTEVRESTKRLYSLSVNGETDEAINNMLDNAKIDELQALAKTYGGKAIGAFSGTCKDCSSTNITLQSSVTGDDVVDSNLDEGVDTSSAAYLTNKFSKKTMQPNVKKAN